MFLDPVKCGVINDLGVLINQETENQNQLALRNRSKGKKKTHSGATNVDDDAPYVPSGYGKNVLSHDITVFINNVMYNTLPAGLGSLGVARLSETQHIV